MSARVAVFFDKDGTLVEDIPYNIDPERIRLSPGAGKAARALARRGYDLFVVSNQSGVARGLFPESALAAVEQRLRALLSECGVALGGFYYCPHHPQGTDARYASNCRCRKPAAGMLAQAARDHQIDVGRSWMIGDILDDVEAGRRAGCTTVLLDNGHETLWRRAPEREAHYIAADLPEAAAIITGSCKP